MQENLLSDIPPFEIEATGFQKFFSTLIDLVIEISMILSVVWFAPVSFRIFLAEYRPFSNYGIAFIIVWGYRLFFILRFGRTLGMMIVSTKYLNADLQPLTRSEKLKITFVRVSGVKQYKLNML